MNWKYGFGSIQQGGSDGMMLRDYARSTAGLIRNDPNHNMLNVVLAYFLGSLFFVTCLALPSERPTEATILIVIYSHISTPVLAVGLALLPSRLIWAAFVAFAICFVVVEIIALDWSGVMGWSAMMMMRGLGVAALVGIIGGLSVRYAMRRHIAGDRFFTMEKAAIFCAVGISVAGFIIGGFAMWVDAVAHVQTLNINEMLFLLAQRIFQLGLCAAGGALIFLSPTDETNPLDACLQAALFALLGWLYNLGIYLQPGLDVTILGLCLLSFRPIHSAIPGVLAGICLFILETGMFVDLPMVLTAEKARQGMLVDLMLLILVLVAMHRVSASRQERVQRQTLGRMTRAQELARFGYFIFEYREQRVFLDQLSQKILSVPDSISAQDFIARIHPDDRDNVTLASTTPSEQGQSFSFRFSLDGPWAEDCAMRHFSGFARFEANDGANDRLTYGIVVDVTQEHAQEEHLRFVLAELSERQGQQTQLFSMISHELRTPAAIMSMIADEMDDGKEWREKGPQMRAVLEHLLSILSDMRQTVRPEQNLPIRIEAFHPRELAASVQDGFKPMAEERGIEIKLDLEDAADQLRGTDRVRLNQTLSNLVKNAILHSQATEIIIGYRETEGPVGQWSVRDNGRNIPAEQREHLFHPFVRNSNSGTRADGSGLGLYIAKGAIELLGGTITYIERPMSGAEFHITLPMSVPKPVAEPQKVKRSAPPPPLDKLVVLVVEDSETMGGLLVAKLSKVFGDVKWVRDGVSGLAWTNLHNPDLVISDLFMPGLGGDEMARKLRERGYDRPIIGMTATEIGEEVERFRKSGADAVITKPIRANELENALALLL